LGGRDGWNGHGFQLGRVARSALHGYAGEFNPLYQRCE
jgi:hypothetical protein